MPVITDPQLGAEAATTDMLEPRAAPAKTISEEASNVAQADTSKKPTSFKEQSAGPPVVDAVGPLATRLKVVFFVAAVVLISEEAFRVWHEENCTTLGLYVGGRARTSGNVKAHALSSASNSVGPEECTTSAGSVHLTSNKFLSTGI
jgi:hypothetical protein